MKHYTPTDHPVAKGFTHAVEAEGRLLFVSGQTPRVPDGGPVADTPAGQIRQIWRNIANVLACAGADLSSIVHVRAFLASREHRAVFTEVRREYLGDHLPAITVVICDIYDEEWVAEVEVVAELPADATS